MRLGICDICNREMLPEEERELRQYWKLTDREHTETFADTVDQVRYLVTDAIHLVAALTAY